MSTGRPARTGGYASAGRLRRMMRRSSSWKWASMAALTLASAAGVSVVFGQQVAPGIVTPGGAPMVSLDAAPGRAVTTTGRGPAPPPAGAWVGAWVQPTNYTEAGQLAAVERFEQDIGRPLDVAHVYHSWLDEFPSDLDLTHISDGRLLLLSWAGTDSRVVTSGRYDQLIRARALALKRTRAPVLLRWRWEMNRPNLQASVWSPDDYVAAWRHVRAIFTEVGADNVGWVWCPIARDFAETRAVEYYPGDDQVDWLCADVYPGKEYDSMAAVMEPFLLWASSRPRPIVIGEFGAPERRPGERAAWLRAAGALISSRPQIKAMVYFDARQERPPVYDLSLRGYADALAAFRQVVNQPYFATAARPAMTGSRDR